MLALAPVALRFGLYAALALAAYGVARTAYNAVYERGWNDAILTVSQKNEASARAAREVQLSVHQCFQVGGEWDVAKGLCIQ
jgi:hypothetical protein